jgi:hypothetical protein
MHWKYLGPLYSINLTSFAVGVGGIKEDPGGVSAEAAKVSNNPSFSSGYKPFAEEIFTDENSRILHIDLFSVNFS